MKRFYYILALLVFTLLANASAITVPIPLTSLDSMALTSINEKRVEPAIYLLEEAQLKPITPINYSRMKVRPVIALQTRMLFQGATSNNTLNNDTLYLHIADTIQSVYKIENFKLILLQSDGEYRHITTSSDIYYFPLPGTRTKSVIISPIAKGLYRIILPDTITSGEYGIFYDFGGQLPVKLYDFKIL